MYFFSHDLASLDTTTLYLERTAAVAAPAALNKTLARAHAHCCHCACLPAYLHPFLNSYLNAFASSAPVAAEDSLGCLPLYLPATDSWLKHCCRFCSTGTAYYAYRILWLFSPTTYLLATCFVRGHGVAMLRTSWAQVTS